MTSESSYATDCNKSLYILVTLNFHPTAHEKTIEITKKKASWNVDFSSFSFKFHFVQLTIHPFKILTQNTDF